VLKSKDRRVITIGSEATVSEAVACLVENNIGSLPVVDGVGRLVGIFTERDVLARVVGTGVDLDLCPVADLMTREPECLTLDDGIAFALNKMSGGGFRHVPLVDEAGRPTGLVSMRSIVDYLVDLFPQVVLNLPPSPALGIPREREGA
jgi:CBS domain-containing protein